MLLHGCQQFTMKKASPRLLRLCEFGDAALSYSRGLVLQQALQQRIVDVRPARCFNTVDLLPITGVQRAGL